MAIEIFAEAWEPGKMQFVKITLERRCMILDRLKDIQYFTSGNQTIITGARGTRSDRA